MIKTILSRLQNIFQPRLYSTKVSTLRNGLTVVTQESCSPLASISLFVEAGPRFETPCNNGITHFIEHMAFKGFKSMNKSCLEETLYYAGMKLSVQTNRDMQIFSTKCPIEYSPNIVDIFCRVITDLELSDYEMDMERYNICLELIDVDNDPKTVLFDYLHQTAFQGTQLAQKVIGPTRNIERFDRASVMNFMCEYYQPLRIVLASSGGIDHRNMMHYADCGLGAWMPDPSKESDYGPCRFTGSQVMYRDDSMPFAHVAVAFEAPGYDSPEYFPMMVAKCIIGSWDKSQSVKEKHASMLARAASVSNLCESYESFYITYKDVGLWGIYFVADKMNVEDILYNVQKQWVAMSTKLTRSDVERGVNALKLEMAKRFDGSINTCYDMGVQMIYSNGVKSAPEICDVLSRIKVSEVRKTASKYLYDRCPAVAAVGPTEGLPEYTRIRASTYSLLF